MVNAEIVGKRQNSRFP